VQQLWKAFVAVRNGYERVRKVAPWLSLTLLRDIFVARFILQRFVLPHTGGTYYGLATALGSAAQNLVQTVAGDQGTQAMDNAGNVLRDKTQIAIGKLRDTGVPVDWIATLGSTDWGALFRQEFAGRMVPVLAFIVGLLCREIFIAAAKARRILGKQVK
jgi:hypothetical protein